MKNSYKITLTSKNEKVQSVNLTEEESYLFTRLLEEREIEDLNIRLSSVRRKSFNFSFVDFVSTNDKTIEENLNSYLNESYEIIDINKLILEEFKKIEIA